MTMRFAVQVLLLFPNLASLKMVAISQELLPSHPPDPGCCLQKYLPDVGNFTFIYVSPEVAVSYGCLDPCIYVKDGTEEKYCFAPGPYQVICEEG